MVIQISSMMYAAGSPSVMLSYDMTMLKRTSVGITPLLLSGLALDVTELLCRRMQVPVVVSRHSSALHVAQPVRPSSGQWDLAPGGKMAGPERHAPSSNLKPSGQAERLVVEVVWSMVTV